VYNKNKPNKYKIQANLATSATSLPDSVWQRVAPDEFGTASNTVRAEDARGQQASKLHVEPNSVDPASFVQQETSKIKVVQYLLDKARFKKRAG
jgi:hypothetical protein